MATSLQSKVVLVTGAGAGIGRASAKAFAREGAKVVIAEIAAEAGQAVADEIAQAGGEALFVQTDVTEPDSVQHAVQRAVTTFGRLDVLFNNAGGTHPNDAPVTDVDLDVFWATMKRDVFGTFLGCRFGIPELIKGGGGAVINMTSIVALIGRPPPARDSYTAAKGAIISLTRGMAVQYAPQKVRVNAIAPGTTLSDFVIGRLARGELPKASTDRLLLGLIDPEDVANAALYLASDASRRLTGHVLPIDSGWSIS